MTEDPIRRLAEADPMQQLDPAPPEDLLARTLALPRAAVCRRSVGARARRHIVIAAVALLAVATGGVLLTDLDGPPLDLAAKAYAQTTTAPEEILYTLVTSTYTRTTAGSPATHRARKRVEEWRRGGETHRIETFVSHEGKRNVSDQVVSADGVLRQVTGDGWYRILRTSDGADAAGAIAQAHAGFIADFRRRYEQGKLDPGGDVTFAGRPARRYSVATVTTLVSRLEQTFYIDRASGAPLGSITISRMRLGSADGRSVLSTTRSVETVRAIKRLEPTPENIKRLRTIGLPRRRDAEGCIRGPITGAGPSAAATKRDCGGTPRAPLPD